MLSQQTLFATCLRLVRVLDNPNLAALPLRVGTAGLHGGGGSLVEFGCEVVAHPGSF